MSTPFVIWTMRRTGGTTFTSLLTTLSEHPGTQHEPFNPNRKFGWVTQSWIERGDPAYLMDALDQVLADRPLIKHCYELVPKELNMALIEATSARGYRHIVLDRETETDRILSLELAKITGAWGTDQAEEVYAQIEAGTRRLDPIDIDAACNHMIACADLRRWLASQFEAALLTPILVYFEEIYGDFETGRRTVEELLTYLEISPGNHPDYRSLLTEALTEKSQNSQSIAHAVPNIDALRDALKKTYAEKGFRFEQAKRRADTVEPSIAPRREPDPEHSQRFILDVHATTGDDTAFYLAKGFSVMAVTHEPAEADALQTRFAVEIDAGQLLVEQSDLSRTEAPLPILDDTIARFGPPHYAKIEGLGSERAIITGLSGRSGLPPYLSFNVNADWEAILTHLAALGYGGFQIVRQGAKHLAPPPKPAREGLYVPANFTAAMSGCFGRELLPENWMELREFVQYVTIVQTRREEARALGKKPGWHDIHCRL